MGSPMRYQPQGLIRLKASGRKPIAAFAAAASGLRIVADGRYSPTAAPNGPNIFMLPSVNGYASRPISGGTSNTIRLFPTANQFNTVWERPSAAVTVMAVFRRPVSSDGAVRPIFGNTSPNTAPYTAWVLEDKGNAQFEIATGGSVRTLYSSSAIPNNTLVVLIGRYDGATMSLWQNGVQVGSQAVTGALTYPNAADRGPAVGNFFDYTGGARSAIMDIYGGALWDTAVTDAEIASLSRNPWQVFELDDDWDDLATAPSGISADLSATIPQVGLISSVNAAINASEIVGLPQVGCVSSASIALNAATNAAIPQVEMVAAVNVPIAAALTAALQQVDFVSAASAPIASALNGNLPQVGIDASVKSGLITGLSVTLPQVGLSAAAMLQADEITAALSAMLPQVVLSSQSATIQFTPSSARTWVIYPESRVLLIAAENRILRIN